jgi:hypothetical protein
MGPPAPLGPVRELKDGQFRLAQIRGKDHRQI